MGSNTKVGKVARDESKKFKVAPESIGLIQGQRDQGVKERLEKKPLSVR